MENINESTYKALFQLLQLFQYNGSCATLRIIDCVDLLSAWGRIW